MQGTEWNSSGIESESRGQSRGHSSAHPHENSAGRSAVKCLLVTTESQHTSIRLRSPSCFNHAGLSQNYTQENANEPGEADNMCACH